MQNGMREEQDQPNNELGNDVRPHVIPRHPSQMQCSVLFFGHDAEHHEPIDESPSSHQ